MSSAQPLAGRTGTAGASPGSRHLGLALLVIATAQLMVILDATIVNVALPDIQRALGFTGSGLEWVVNAYARHGCWARVPSREWAGPSSPRPRCPWSPPRSPRAGHATGRWACTRR